MSLKKLQQMIDSDKEYIYRGQKAVISGYQMDHGQYVIYVEILGKTEYFTKETEEKIGLFLECFKEVEVEPAIVRGKEESGVTVLHKSEKLPLLYLETKDNLRSLTSMLLSDIEKVRDNPAYVGQAKQVCNNVSAIINITKLQLQLLQKS